MTHEDLGYKIKVSDEDMRPDNVIFAHRLIEAIMQICVNVKRVYNCDIPQRMEFSGRMGKALYELLMNNKMGLPGFKLVINEKTKQERITISLGRKIQVLRQLGDDRPTLAGPKKRPRGMGGDGTILPGLINSPPSSMLQSTDGIKVEKDIDPTAIIELIKKDK